MNRYYSYLNSANRILDEYKGEEPFASFLKKYFSANKKYGSKDRKQISHLCYCYFRMGKAVTPSPPQRKGLPDSPTIEERILAGLFMCSSEPNEILAALKPEWNETAEKGIEEKYSIFNNQFSNLNVFPWKEELSEGIDHEKFCKSFFVQPDLFLRIRSGNEEIVKGKLKQAGIQFETLTDDCLALPNATKIDNVIELDREAVVQDYSSQRTGDFIQWAMGNWQLPIAVWDCCSGSGGKSIMIYDINPEVELTVSDVRESSLINLKKRFHKAGIKNYKSFTVDLSGKNYKPRPTGSSGRAQTKNYKLILADVPCSGSGTWSRTPEQLYYFDERKIVEYASLQRKIVSNIIPHLQPGGCFIYITCSVFKRENEEVVEFARTNFNLQVKQVELLKGYDKKADSMFVAVLTS